MSLLYLYVENRKTTGTSKTIEVLSSIQGERRTTSPAEKKSEELQVRGIKIVTCEQNETPDGVR